MAQTQTPNYVIHADGKTPKQAISDLESKVGDLGSKVSDLPDPLSIQYIIHVELNAKNVSGNLDYSASSFEAARTELTKTYKEGGFKVTGYSIEQGYKLSNPPRASSPTGSIQQKQSNTYGITNLTNLLK